MDPFGLPSKVRGQKFKDSSHPVKLYSRDGASYISESNILKTALLDKWKVITSILTAEHAMEPGKDGKFHVFTKTMRVLGPKEVCNFSYLVAGDFEAQSEAQHLEKYLKTKLSRFLVLQAISSIHLSRSSFQFVPMQNFSPSSDIPWEKPLKDVEEALCQKYGLDSKDREFIDSLIREW